MKNFFLLMATILVSISANIQAQNCYDFCCGDPCNEYKNNFYAEILGGANFLQTETKGGIKSHYQTGYIVSGSLGYRWCYGLRGEAEYAFRRNCLKKAHFFERSFSIGGHFQSSSYMANVLWDLPLSDWGCDFWGIRPFIGGGIGYDFQQIRASSRGLSFKENKKNFAWQVIAGLGYPIFCNTDISLEYKFHKGGFKHLYNHSLGVGLTYNFDFGF
jgi:opacity protein-like surface antigen